MKRAVELIILLLLWTVSPLSGAEPAPAGREQLDSASDRQLEKRVDDIDRQLDRLEEELKKARKNTQAELKKRIPELRKRQRELEARFEELKTSGGKAWKEIADGVQKAIEDLNKALDRAQSTTQEDMHQQ